MPNDTGLAGGRTDPRVVAAALAGLRARPKTLPPWLFYDAAGCRLFYRITELPEYYLTRAERAPLAQAAAHLAGLVPAGSTLIEYGASDEGKALVLLDQVGHRFSRYVPIDVAAGELAQVQERLRIRLPGLDVRPVVADFMDELTLPARVGESVSLGFFPGSTIGNLEPDQAQAFLRRAHAALGPGARFLLGADLRKDPAILLPAYDDAAGVTADFNRNLLVRLNRDAAANFDPTGFRHEARWNDPESRIEMHLVSVRDQQVRIAGETVSFRAGESIHTENSYKHTPERMVALARGAGWRLVRRWTDPDGLFAVYLFDAEPA